MKSSDVVLLVLVVCCALVLLAAAAFVAYPPTRKWLMGLFNKKGGGGGGGGKAGSGAGSGAGGGAALPAVASGGGVWKKATATWYSSYPDCCHDKKANQSECSDYSGCKYEGMFAAFDGKKPKEWVESNNIIAFYASPNSTNRKEWDKKWKNKKMRIRNPKTGKSLDVTVVDTCDDGDCGGCCSKNANKGGGFLIDLEKNTAKRFYEGNVQDLTTIDWQEI